MHFTGNFYAHHVCLLVPGEVGQDYGPLCAVLLVLAEAKAL